MVKKKPVKTLHSELDAAEICRRNGWRNGTLLVGEEDGELQTIKITAVGESEILTKVVKGLDDDLHGEEVTDLNCREWRKVPR